MSNIECIDLTTGKQEMTARMTRLLISGGGWGLRKLSGTVSQLSQLSEKPASRRPAERAGSYLEQFIKFPILSLKYHICQPSTFLQNGINMEKYLVKARVVLYFPIVELVRVREEREREIG